MEQLAYYDMTTADESSTCSVWRGCTVQYGMLVLCLCYALCAFVTYCLLNTGITLK